MKLIIVRHGESEADILNVHEGMADFSLTDLGKEQAQDLAKSIKVNYNVTKIISSPLRRAKAVAELIGEATGISVEFEDNLMEHDNGLLAGHSYEYAARKFPEKELTETSCDYNKESVRDFRNRVSSVYDKVVASGTDTDTVVLVTHGGVINQLYRHMLGLSVMGKQFFTTGDTGLHEWDIYNGKVKVSKSNSLEHLSPTTMALMKGDCKKKVSYFAGGCFWCITPIFKMYRADKSLCGYSGGDEVNPTYEDVKHQKTGHRETIAVEYKTSMVTYDKLVDIFLANVDPFDKEGQFIDKGFSYTLALYYTNEEEKQIAERKIRELEEKSGKEVYIAIEEFKNFYEAETYHQDYYLKNPEAFEKELIESGRKRK